MLNFGITLTFISRVTIEGDISTSEKATVDKRKLIINLNNLQLLLTYITK